MGTLTFPKAASGAKHLQTNVQEMPSYLRLDSTKKRVFGRGTGSAPAVETEGLPDILPPGHNIIGTGGKFEEAETED